MYKWLVSLSFGAIQGECKMEAYAQKTSLECSKKALAFVLLPEWHQRGAACTPTPSMLLCLCIITHPALQKWVRRNIQFNKLCFFPPLCLAASEIQLTVNDADIAPEDLVFELVEPPHHGALFKHNTGFPDHLSTGKLNLRAFPHMMLFVYGGQATQYRFLSLFLFGLA